MSVVDAENNDAWEQQIVEPSNSETDTLGSHSNDPATVKKGVTVMVVDNFKYIFQSKHKHSLNQTWRCSFRPSCKGAVGVDNDGGIIWFSANHNHPPLTPQQLQTGAQYEIQIHKGFIKGAFPNKINRLTESEKNISGASPKYDSTSSTSSSIFGLTENIAIRHSQEEDRSDDSASLETDLSKDGTFEHQESALPRLGPAFSVVGRKDMIMMHPINQRPKSYKSSDPKPFFRNETSSAEMKQDGIPVLCAAFSLASQTDAEESLGQQAAEKLYSQHANIAENDNEIVDTNSSSADSHAFSVRKTTKTMRNILALALQELGKETFDEPEKSIAGPSKAFGEWHTVRKEQMEDFDINEKIAEELQWKFMERETDEDEVEDEEINVDV